VAVSPARHLVLVVNTFDELESDKSSVSIVDTLSGRSSKIEGLPLPADVAVDESGNRLLATVRGGLLVATLPSGKPRRTVAFGKLPRQVAVDAARGRALVTDADENALYVLRLSDLTHSGRVVLPGAPSALAVDPVTGTAYVTIGEAGLVVRVAVNGAGVPTITGRVDLDGGPDALAVDGVRKQVYVVERDANVLDVLSFAAFGP
jgi:DNA-binding beta-propeller fold protein YncE